MNRNELKSLDLATKIYKRKERIVLSDMLPNVAFMANYLVTNPNSMNGFKNEFAGMFNVGVMVKFRFPAGGRAVISAIRLVPRHASSLWSYRMHARRWNCRSINPFTRSMKQTRS